MTHLPGEVDTADELRARLAPVIEQQSRANNVDPRVLTALFEQESGFNPDVVYGRIQSSAGAKGLAQFIDATAEDFNLDPLDPEDSVRAAAQFLSQNLRRYNDDYTLALAAYNWGPGNVDRYLYSGGEVPAETQTYLQNISAASVKAGVNKVVFESGILELAKEGFTDAGQLFGGSALNATGEFLGVPQIDNPLSTLGDFVGFVTNPENLARVALTGAAVGMIALGVIVFVFSTPVGKTALSATPAGGVAKAASAAASEGAE